MALDGQIPVTGGQSLKPPSSWFLIGTDGKHYTCSGLTGVQSRYARIGCAETNAHIFDRTAAEWRADFDAFALPGVPPADDIAQCPIPVAGTPYFFITGKAYNGVATRWNIGVRYRIDSPSSVVPDRAFAYRYATSSGALAGGLGTSWCYGSQLIGDDVFAVLALHNGFAIFDNDPGIYLVRIPFCESGSITESSLAVWPTRRTSLQSITGGGIVDNYFSQDRSFCAILPYGTEDDSVLILTYRNFNTSLPGDHCNLTSPGSESLIVNYSAQSLGTLNSQQAALGQPWTDEGLGYDGTPSVTNNEENCYYAPTVTDLGDGTFELLFGRCFADAPTINGFRRVIYDPATGTFTPDSSRYDFETAGTAGEDDGDKGVMGRRDGDRLLMARHTSAAWKLSEAEFALPGPCESSGFDLAYPPCVTTFTQCVKITRRDGVAFRFTSLDRDYPNFRGERYLTCGGLDPSATQTLAQVGEVSSSELSGLITATGVEEEELYGGLFDDAFVEIWLVDYEGSEPPRRLAAGWAGKIPHSTRGYRMEVLGPGARLEQRPIVQTYTPQCRWVFGDERCGVDIEALAITGTVTSGLNRGVFTASLGDPASSGTGAPESSGALPGQFANGKVIWLTGVNAGQTTEVKEVDFDTGVVTLWALTCRIPEAGDTFSLYPGCAQDFATCKDVYDNALRFGGFPHTPGRDAITRSPDAKVAT